MDIKEQVSEVLKCYPTMQYSSERNELSGELFISDYDSYQIRIDLTPYPRLFPNVFEIDERIPNKPSRHIYTDTGGCCLTTKAKAQILLKTKIKSLKEFVRDIVIPYLQNNSYFEINKKYKTEEYAHHHQGIVDGYKDILRINNETLIAKIIYHRINQPKLKIYLPCYCGSGLKLKNCSKGIHEKAYRDFKLIDKELLAHDLYQTICPMLKEKGIL